MESVSALFIPSVHRKDHSGPASMRFRGSMGHVDNAWLDSTLKKIETLISRLPATLAPAAVKYGSTHVEGLGYNRQDRSRAVDNQLQTVIDQQSNCIPGNASKYFIF